MDGLRRFGIRSQDIKATSGARTELPSNSTSPASPVMTPRFLGSTNSYNNPISKPARIDSSSPTAFSTNVSSTSSQHLFSGNSRSLIVAVPGIGLNRTRSGAMSPRRLSKSARVRTGGWKTAFILKNFNPRLASKQERPGKPGAFLDLLFVPHLGALLALLFLAEFAFAADDFGCDGVFTLMFHFRQIVHDIQHHILDNRSQTACTGVTGFGQAGNFL